MLLPQMPSDHCHQMTNMLAVIQARTQLLQRTVRTNETLSAEERRRLTEHPDAILTAAQQLQAALAACCPPPEGQAQSTAPKG